MEQSGICQVIMETHAPMLMAYPGARLLAPSNAGLAPVRLEDMAHFSLLRDFWTDPTGFVQACLGNDGARTETGRNSV
jgi:predicted ATPase